MFLNTIKRFILKKRLNSIFDKSLSLTNNDAIKTIGVFIDETTFFETEKLINEIKKYANGQFKINVLLYRKKPNKNETVNYSYFSSSDISFSGQINKGEVENFIQYPFDLLISYYEFQNIDLELVTALSKAKFKVGFESINKKLNHFFVTTHMKNYHDFMEVLFNYLKILKKI